MLYKAKQDIEKKNGLLLLKLALEEIYRNEIYIFLVKKKQNFATGNIIAFLLDS